MPSLKEVKVDLQGDPEIDIEGDEQTKKDFANKKKKVPGKFYQSFKTIDFKNYSYSIPELTDDYLTYRYGEWQTPVKDWDTANDDKALA